MVAYIAYPCPIFYYCMYEAQCYFLLKCRITGQGIRCLTHYLLLIERSSAARSNEEMLTNNDNILGNNTSVVS